jgi:hypothetical protein
MDAFWTNNPCSPTWSGYIQSWWGSSPPRLAEPGRYVFPIKPVPGVILRKIQVTECRLVTEFWHRFFSTSERCKCFVPPDHIETCVKDGLWEVYVAIDSRSGILVGTGVRRWITNLHLYEALWKKAAMIDYFCVHPAWRKKGVGRWILGTLQNTGPVPLPPHLILWDGIQAKTPPLSLGMYWVKERIRKQVTLLQTIPRPSVWPPPGSSIWSEWSINTTKEVKCWKTTSGEVVAWNTFHRRVPDGAEVGIVLWSSTDACLEEFVEEGPYGVILSITKPSTAGWSMDSPWQLIAYNCIASPGVSFPLLGF